MSLLEEMAFRLTELERRVNNTVREGRAVEIDPAKGVRVAIAEGSDGNPVLSPWIKPMEQAGTLVSWSPPKIGQWFKLISPNGEIGPNSIAIPHSYANGIEQPSTNPDEPMFKVGNSEVRLSGSAVTIKGSKLVIAADVEITGGIIANGKNIGSDHAHVGVLPGGGNTGEPV